MNEYLESLIEDIRENPEIVEDFDKYSPETVDKIINKLEKSEEDFKDFKNIYSFTNKKEGHNEVILSFTNLQDKYNRRLVMTSLVSFIFKVLDEYTIDKEERFYIPEQYDIKDTDPFKSTELKEYIQLIDSLNCELENVEKNYNELLGSKEDNNKELYELEKQRAALTYTLTMLIKRQGIKADAKFENTRKEADKFPDVRKNTKRRNYLPEIKEFEFPEKKAKNIIYNFLRTYFEFDPSIHVKSSLDEVKTSIDQELQKPIVISDNTKLDFETLGIEPNIIEKDKPFVDILRKTDTSRLMSLCILQNRGTHRAILKAIEHSKVFKEMFNVKLDYNEWPFPKKLNHSENDNEFVDRKYYKKTKAYKENKKNILEKEKEQNENQKVIDRWTGESTIPYLNVPISFEETLKVLTYDDKLFMAFSYIINNEDIYDAIREMIEQPAKYLVYLGVVKNIKDIKIPPRDTFHRWDYYTSVNYEELVVITEAIFPEKSYTSCVIAVWDVLTGETKEECDKQYEEFCKKYEDRMFAVQRADLGTWCFFGDTKTNRQVINFYNNNTTILKSIADRVVEDQKLGAALMKNRVVHTKARNIEEHGPDAPGLKQYRATQSSDGKDLISKGAERVISPEEMKRLEKTRGNTLAAKELEVIDEYLKKLNGYDSLKVYRPLNEEELNDYEITERKLKQAKEMINVPDDAIQVDVFTTGEDGSFTKSHFYTKCEEALAKANEL